MALKWTRAKFEFMSGGIFRMLILIGTLSATTFASRGHAQPPTNDEPQIEEWIGVRKKTPSAKEPSASPDVWVIDMPEQLAPRQECKEQQPQALMTADKIGTPPIVTQQTSSQAPAPVVILPPPPGLWPAATPIAENSSPPGWDGLPHDLKNDKPMPAEPQERETGTKAEKTTPAITTAVVEHAVAPPAQAATPAFGPDSAGTNPQPRESHSASESAVFQFAILACGLMVGAAVVIILFFFRRRQTSQASGTWRIELAHGSAPVPCAVVNPPQTAAPSNAPAHTVEPKIPESSPATPSQVNVVQQPKQFEIGLDYGKKRLVTPVRLQRVQDAVLEKLFAENMK